MSEKPLQSERFERVCFRGIEICGSAPVSHGNVLLLSSFDEMHGVVATGVKIRSFELKPFLTIVPT